jgi:hypothetical protein
MYVTVPRATDAGYSVDVIDTYRRVAVDAAKDAEKRRQNRIYNQYRQRTGVYSWLLPYFWQVRKRYSS